MLDVLGVDIGGVIIDKANDGTDTAFFGENYLATTAVPDAFEAIRELRARFGGRVYLVSKCGKTVQEKTLHWLAHHRFWEKTGMSSRNIRFCRRRDQKAPICQEFGITHFVDDRLEVLGYLQTVPNRFLFQAEAREMEKFAHHLPRVTRVETWHEIKEILCR